MKAISARIEVYYYSTDGTLVLYSVYCVAPGTESARGVRAVAQPQLSLSPQYLPATRQLSIKLL